ncbi:MAG: alpha/beta hydrolase, partial [Planctomycetota bacterium]|nr:alpha/beta hydrolase [Planctomycetota bacterium]
VPCLILWGARDKSFSKNMGYKVQALIPDAKLCVLAESMHSLPSTRPRTCATAIRNFVTTRGEELPERHVVNFGPGEGWPTATGCGVGVAPSAPAEP